MYNFDLFYHFYFFWQFCKPFSWIFFMFSWLFPSDFILFICSTTVNKMIISVFCLAKLSPIFDSLFWGNFVCALIMFIWSIQLNQLLFIPCFDFYRLGINCGLVRYLMRRWDFAMSHLPRSFFYWHWSRAISCLYFDFWFVF